MASFVLDNVSLSPSRLAEVSLEIGSGTTAVLGASGAGKSSLLSILAGYLKPTSGTVAAEQPVSWVPQEGGLWAGLSVWEHLCAVTRDSKESASVLASFDLGGCEDRPAEKLSRGQQARLAVARAILSDAPVLVMDEPLAHVAPSRQAHYWDAIRSATARHKRALVFATHDPGFALAEAEESICLKDGSVLCHRRTEDLYWRPGSAEEALFLGPVNWLEEKDQAVWLQDDGILEAPCVRPEQIKIVPTQPGDDRAPKVAAVRFYGSQEAVTIVHPETDERRTFWHRPARPILAPGARVSIQRIEPSPSTRG